MKIYPPAILWDRNHINRPFSNYRLVYDQNGYRYIKKEYIDEKTRMIAKRRTGNQPIRYYEGETSPIIKIGTKFKELSFKHYFVDCYFPIEKNEIRKHNPFFELMKKLKDNLGIVFESFYMYGIIQGTIDLSHQVTYTKKLLHETAEYIIAYGHFFNKPITLFEKPSCNGRIKIIGYDQGRTINGNAFARIKNKKGSYWLNYLLEDDVPDPYHSFITKIGFGMI